jgi:transcriptional regulator with XRE-family HTH domain
MLGGVEATPDHRSDIGRRIALRREQLGLSRGDVASRAGMAREYLTYLEEQQGAPSADSLTRLARALETTVTELSGGRPAPGEPARPPGESTVIPAGECRALLAAHRVGRVAVATRTGPAIVPVAYTLVEGDIVFRAAPGMTPPVAPGEQVAFEVDRLDEAQHVGWLVQAAGPAELVTDPGQAASLAARTRDAVPWFGTADGPWVRLRPGNLTGRRLRLA